MSDVENWRKREKALPKDGTQATAYNSVENVNERATNMSIPIWMFFCSVFLVRLMNYSRHHRRRRRQRHCSWQILAGKIKLLFNIQWNCCSNSVLNSKTVQVTLTLICVCREKKKTGFFPKWAAWFSQAKPQIDNWFGNVKTRLQRTSAENTALRSNDMPR